MAKLGATVLHLAVLLFVVEAESPEALENLSEIFSYTSDYSDDDIFTPPATENFDIFDWHLCRELAHRDKGNIVVSPISVKLVLAMLYEGASGNTAKELEKTLHLSYSRLDTRTKFYSILKSLQTKHDDYVLDVGTKVYVPQLLHLSQRFSRILKSFYSTDIQKLDFGKPSEAVQTVNSWVNEATRGHIKSMFDEDMVTADTVILLVNAIYFKGLWRYPFNKTDTREEKFQVRPNEKVNVPFMTMEHDLYFSQSVELDSSILRLPYIGDKYSMFIVLPSKPDGLDRLLEKVSPSVLRNQLFHMEKIPVNVKIPKYKFDFTVKLEETLKELGITEIFDSSKANFTTITNEKPHVSQFFQKAGLEVNEEGTTAFASTGVSLVNKFGGDIAIDFHATYPFMFFIQDEATGTVIFVGKVVNPSLQGDDERPNHHQRVTDNETVPGLLGRMGPGRSQPPPPRPRPPKPYQRPAIGVPANTSPSYNDVLNQNITIPLKLWAYIFSELTKLEGHKN